MLLLITNNVSLRFILGFIYYLQKQKKPMERW